ncbi:MAG: hypothetical protein ACTSRS_21755 [Candidatus Helarchaeota archaeon]
MTEINTVKDLLIDRLWLKSVLKGGKEFFPRLRKNKNMKMLTLTNDDNYNEINRFIEKKLTVTRLIYAWNHDRFKALRLETEGKAKRILGPTRFEETIVTSEDEIIDKFPFDILNLDFSSQDPESEVGRLERELLGLEKTIKLQKEKQHDKRGYVLIFTTLINSRQVNCQTLIDNCRDIRVQGWNGNLRFEGNPVDVTEQTKKVEIIESILDQLSNKYNYYLELEKIEIELNKGKSILSIAAIIKHR